MPNPKITLLLLFLSPFAQCQPFSGYKTYCNARYSYCVDYPQSLRGQGEAENGDGQVFLSGADLKLEIRVFGSNNVMEESLAGILKQLTDELRQNGGTVEYRRKGKNWLVISGTKEKGTEIYYSKVLQNGDQLVTLILTYPTAQKEKLDAQVRHISGSIRIEKSPRVKPRK